MVTVDIHNNIDALCSTTYRSGNSLASRLATVDWNFPGRLTHSRIEGVHAYPAKFIAEIPRTLLEILPIPPDAAVLDPFCGSGTALVEAQRCGLASAGIDLNPIACLITRVKTGQIPPDMDKVGRVVVKTALRAEDIIIPNIPNLNHWFVPEVQGALAALSSTITTAPAEYLDVLRLALSSIVVRVSNQDSNTRYAAVQKQVTKDDVFRHFLSSISRIYQALSERSYPLTSTQTLNADTLTIDPSLIARPVGLVITSPPYPNAYEYWLYHKYRMYWLGFDPIEVRENEIGARCHFFRRNGHTADDFRRQMTVTLELLDRLLIPNGFACFVIGRSRIHGKIVDNALILAEVALALGFEIFFTTDRSLATNRKSFNPSYGQIRSETILVLRRGS